MERKKKFSLIFMLLSANCLIHIIESTTNVKLKSNEKNNNYFLLIDNESIIHLKNLNTISISLNEYCKSKQDCFQNVHDLDFSSNNLKQIPNDLINKWFNYASLNTFNIAHNLIENLTLNLPPTNSLESIDLSFNRLSSIEADTFRNLNSIKYLNLASNKLSSINSFAFEKTRYLIDLNLNNNLITENSMEFLLFASLTNLKYLRMDNNRLASLSHHLLFNLYSLEYLSLKENNLLSFEILKLSKNNLLLKVCELSSLNLNIKINFFSNL
jgi:Leucine-rich repeat (LRR) protein